MNTWIISSIITNRASDRYSEHSKREYRYGNVRAYNLLRRHPTYLSLHSLHITLTQNYDKRCACEGGMLCVHDEF